MNPDPATKLTVVIVIHHYLPGYLTGGPVRTTANLVEWLGDEINFKILTANHEKGTMQPYDGIQAAKWYNVGKAQVRYLSPHELRPWKLARVFSQFSFDVIYLDSVLALTSIQTLMLDKLRLIPRKPIILAPRGHLDPGALSLKASKKRLFLRMATLIGLYQRVTWHASSETEQQDIQREFGTGGTPRTRMIPNLPAPILRSKLIAPLAKQIGQLRVVFFSRISRKKNLEFAVKALQNLRGKITFDIYGPIEDPTYWDECQSLLAQLPPNVTAAYKGAVPFENVVPLLSDYHLFVLPTLGENFGHVILEALCAGCPALISDRTPWTDLAECGAGWTIPLDDRRGYEQVIQTMVDLDETAFNEARQRAWVYGSRHSDSNRAIEQTRQLLLDQG